MTINILDIFVVTILLKSLKTSFYYRTQTKFFWQLYSFPRPPPPPPETYNFVKTIVLMFFNQIQKV